MNPQKRRELCDEAIAQIAAAKALQSAADSLIAKANNMKANAFGLVPASRPGSVIRDRKTGKVFVVKDQGGGIVLDTLGDRGLIPMGLRAWFEFDVMEESDVRDQLEVHAGEIEEELQGAVDELKGTGARLLR